MSLQLNTLKKVVRKVLIISVEKLHHSRCNFVQLTSVSWNVKSEDLRLLFASLLWRKSSFVDRKIDDKERKKSTLEFFPFQTIFQKLSVYIVLKIISYNTQTKDEFVFIFNFLLWWQCHHFVEPSAFSVLDFSWLYLQVLKPGWMHYCLHSVFFVHNGSLELTLIAETSLVPILHLGTVWLSLEWLANKRWLLFVWNVK